MDFATLLQKHFTAKLFPKDTSLELTIASWRVEETGKDKDPAGFLYFVEDPRGLRMNTTNASIIAASHRGSTKPDNWIGAKIALFLDLSVNNPTNPGGGGIRVRVISPAPVVK